MKKVIFPSSTAPAPVFLTDVSREKHYGFTIGSNVYKVVKNGDNCKFLAVDLGRTDGFSSAFHEHIDIKQVLEEVNEWLSKTCLVHTKILEFDSFEELCKHYFS